MSADGGPAFPVESSWDDNYSDEAGYARTRRVTGLRGGMSLRDYFAGKVLEGLVADGILQDEPTTIRIANAAAASYVLADAMLAERAKCKT